MERGIDVRLVPITPELDAPLMQSLINEDRDHIENYDLGFSDFSTVEAVQEYLANRCQEFAFGIIKGNRMVGNIYLSATQNPDIMSVSYWVAKSHTNKGIGTEAVRQAADFAFSSLDTQIVLASVSKENNPSTSLLKHLGFASISKKG
jgi:RimJ/RimL family protein N-acetyltransferase